MLLLYFLCLLLLLSCAEARPGRQQAALEDKHESCEFWASIDECKKNPNYMLVNCAKSCAAVSSATPTTSFYDIVERDLYGNELRFDQFRGKVVYIVNVASYCGYTQEGYELLRRLHKYESQGLEIIIAPCNQFGAQEPGNSAAISTFAHKQGYIGYILSKADVNGENTRPAFRFLKSATGRGNINWNFDGKFLVDRNGKVWTPSEDVEADVQRLLGGEEL